MPYQTNINAQDVIKVINRPWNRKTPSITHNLIIYFIYCKYTLW